MSTEESGLRFSNTQLEEIYSNLKQEELKIRQESIMESQQFEESDIEESQKENKASKMSSSIKSQNYLSGSKMVPPQIKFYDESKIIVEERKKIQENVEYS